MTIQVHIALTGKGFHPASEWERFGDESHTFDTMAAAKAYLRERYGKSKRVPMYQDRQNTAPIQCGWVYGFRNADWSHSPVQHWIEQDWVHVSEITSVDIGAKKGKA